MSTEIISGYSIDGSTLALGSNNTIQVNSVSNAQIGLAASASNSVTTPVTTTSTTAYSTVHSLSFTPAKTGKVLVIARLIVNNNTAGNGVSVELLNGTTVVDGPYTLLSSAANHNQSITLIALLSGLTVGTPVTLSTAIQAVTGGTASATGILIAMELLS